MPWGMITGKQLKYSGIKASLCYGNYCLGASGARLNPEEVTLAGNQADELGGPRKHQVQFFKKD